MTRKSLIELALLLGRDTNADAQEVLWLLRQAAAYRRIAEAACNRELTAKEKRKQRTLGERIYQAALNFGATGVLLSGDPHGCCVKLTVRSGKTNDMAGEGICIL